jgi:uncharacterized protein (TIGR00251 family)
VWYRWEKDKLLIELRVQPRASRDGFAEPMGERLKVRITAPPVDGKANAHLVKFLAKAFGVPRSSVRIVRGQTGREKTVAIDSPGRLPDEIPITAAPGKT